ncbi:MAG: hypothetical protein HY288_18665 [Planctomycetia bacterium]|nr:hypothetical protein [Planctomycetia bacterium]
MEIPTRNDLDNLLQSACGDVVSVYLPTHWQGDDSRQDPIRLKNLLRQAEKQLLERGHGSVQVREQLEPARTLLTDVAFWKDRRSGLAIFLAPSVFRAFRTPIPFDELAVVSRQFYITPLVPLLVGDGAFYVLAVSQKHVRLLWGDRFSEHVVEVEGLPPNIAEALNYQPPQQMYQAHLFVNKPGGAHLRAIHGQGGASDVAKEEILEYFRLVDKALHPFLHEKRLPLVFVGVDYLFPIYRKANSYPHLEDVHVYGSPDTMNDHELHRLAWEILQPRFEHPRKKALRRAHEQAESNRSAYELPAILRGAAEGRVESLFIARGAQEWGTFDPVAEQIRLAGASSAESEELLNRATIDTLTQGGKVYLVDRAELPRKSTAAALYRYALTPGNIAAEGRPH